MNKIFSIQIILVLLSINLEAQTYTFIYGKMPAKSEDDLSLIKESDIRNSFASIMKSLNEVSYELVVSNDAAKFYHVEQLYPPNFNKRAVSWYGGNVPYFYNRKDKKVVYSETFNGVKYLVSKDIFENNWKITKETKKINGYTCYKATQEKVSDDIRGKFIFTEVAWFCPEFPFPYGPHDFYGLPGVVFEAYTENTYVKFYLKQIIFKEDSTTISIPNGKYVSEAEINAIFEKHISNFKNLNND